MKTRVRYTRILRHYVMGRDFLNLRNKSSVPQEECQTKPPESAIFFPYDQKQKRIFHGGKGEVGSANANLSVNMSQSLRAMCTMSPKEASYKQTVLVQQSHEFIKLALEVINDLVRSNPRDSYNLIRTAECAPSGFCKGRVLPINYGNA